MLYKSGGEKGAVSSSRNSANSMSIPLQMTPMQARVHHLQKVMGNRMTRQVLHSTIQRKPVKADAPSDGYDYLDDKVAGLKLKLVTSADEIGMDEEDWKYNEGKCFKESFSQKYVLYEDGQYIDLETNETWVPKAPGYDYKQVDHYKTDSNVIVDISTIIYGGIGNPQPAKKAVVIEGIEAGAVMPPIKVTDNGDGTYTLIDGRNRIDASLEMGYTKIPIAIQT